MPIGLRHDSERSARGRRCALRSNDASRWVWFPRQNPAGRRQQTGAIRGFDIATSRPVIARLTLTPAGTSIRQNPDKRDIRSGKDDFRRPG
jgi:hypothetical protein